VLRHNNKLQVQDKALQLKARTRRRDKALRTKTEGLLAHPADLPKIGQLETMFRAVSNQGLHQIEADTTKTRSELLAMDKVDRLKIEILSNLTTTAATITALSGDVADHLDVDEVGEDPLEAVVAPQEEADLAGEAGEDLHEEGAEEEVALMAPQEEMTVETTSEIMTVEIMTARKFPKRNQRVNQNLRKRQNKPKDRHHRKDQGFEAQWKTCLLRFVK